MNNCQALGNQTANLSYSNNIPRSTDGKKEASGLKEHICKISNHPINLEINNQRYKFPYKLCSEEDSNLSCSKKNELQYNKNFYYALLSNDSYNNPEQLLHKIDNENYLNHYGKTSGLKDCCPRNVCFVEIEFSSKYKKAFNVISDKDWIKNETKIILKNFNLTTEMKNFSYDLIHDAFYPKNNVDSLFFQLQSDERQLTLNEHIILISKLFEYLDKIDKYELRYIIPSFVNYVNKIIVTLCNVENSLCIAIQKPEASNDNSRTKYTNYSYIEFLSDLNKIEAMYNFGSLDAAVNYYTACFQLARIKWVNAEIEGIFDFLPENDKESEDNETIMSHNIEIGNFEIGKIFLTEIEKYLRTELGFIKHHKNLLVNKNEKIIDDIQLAINNKYIGITEKDKLDALKKYFSQNIKTFEINKDENFYDFFLTLQFTAYQCEKIKNEIMGDIMSVKKRKIHQTCKYYFQK